MENSKLSSALFAGTHFNRKRFAADFARFHQGPTPSPTAPSAPSPEKKRKRKSGKAKAKKNKKKRAEAAAASASDIREGFSVFKGLSDKNEELPSEKVDIGKDEDSVAVRRRKEIEREIERVAVLRKRFDIHIAGQNVPAPLESFEELISRYGCDSYLVGNLSKLGFQEPTPIQRQAIPILLSGRECFACAPTGSGKTLAFLFPLLMKIKSLNPPVLIFVQSKERAKELYKELAFDDVRANVIHADLNEEQRQDAVDNLRAGKTWVLIATEVIARGMDFKGVNCVINYDFPESAAAYIHRIGKKDIWLWLTCTHNVDVWALIYIRLALY
ncbi:DEAD-box ATP-dependent RNA helicase 57 [Dichanthelium oligosanthes]|uniref:RNA helicase n=1 Tax=Dichanthelium oligosanthes TaxID=888268 RepID=A0A1E5UN40_9POAL|nr:DEAD-box ATP-dependent RNA helicase 57 [Dichanthelium oligosanthes]